MNESSDYSHYIRRNGDGSAMMDFAVEDITCAACITKIESALHHLPGVEQARINYTNRRLHVEWSFGRIDPARFIAELKKIGYRAYPFNASSVESEEARQMKWLLLCLAVAAFGAMNIMLLSVSIWAGDASIMSTETRDFFHWLSALIALPVAAFAGQPFFLSALRALRARSLNMDVPISIGIVLALLMSVYETAHHADHAYFDSAVMLLTFLLLGRTLDHAMRRKTREIAGNLASLRVPLASRQEADGSLTLVPAGALTRDDLVIVRPGERIPADGLVLTGASEVDESLVTGETRHRPVAVGDELYAGAMNFSGQLTVRVSAAGDHTLLGEVERLMNNAMMAKAKTMRLADKVARYYAPFVHLTALVTALCWLARGASLHDSILAAITVLIITCPCALALAVPAVQVAASGALFRAGLLLNAGDAIERFADIDMIVFDKTGTLTLPDPDIANRAEVPDDLFALALRLAQSSHHPLAKALARAGASVVPFDDVEEISGSGVQTLVDGQTVRLGSPTFCGLADAGLPDRNSVLAVQAGARSAILHIEQNLRHDAVTTLRALQAQGYKIGILSGDRAEAVAPIAAQLGVTQWQAGVKPAEKTAVLTALQAQGHRVLMVGDGLNDAPALAAATASISPVTAADLAQACADAVFMGDQLAPIVSGLRLARRAKRLMIENLSFSIIYNVIALPLAMTGYVTPLIAALAMSGSSVLVTVNALRAQSPLRSLRTN